MKLRISPENPNRVEVFVDGWCGGWIEITRLIRAEDAQAIVTAVNEHERLRQELALVIRDREEIIKKLEAAERLALNPPKEPPCH